MNPDRRGTQSRVARGFESPVARNRIAERADRGIRSADEQIAKEVYPQVALLKQVKGVGTLIALTYVLTLDNPHRFRRSRDAGVLCRVTPWP
jgi:hypothetical protein